MKQKTEWVNFESKISRPRNFWLQRTGKAMFGYEADVRWVNIFGQKIEAVELHKGSRILGDE